MDLDLSKDWTPELLEQYQHLSIPSLYDFAVSGEKLSLEIKRQNQEFRSMQEAIAKLSDLIKTDHTAKEELLISIKKEHQKILIEACDAIFLLQEQANKSTKEISLLLGENKKRFHKKKQQQSKKIHALFSSFAEGTGLLQTKFLSALADLGIKSFTPNAGERFSPQEHRAVLQKKGEGPSGTIYKTVRMGYKTTTNLIRYADVIINL